jgi:integrase
MSHTKRFAKLTDAIVKQAQVTTGKSEDYLYDTELTGLAIRIRGSGGKSWVYLFTKPGTTGTQRMTLGSWPKLKEREARAAAKIATGDLVRTGDPNAAKREAKKQQLAAKGCVTLGTLIDVKGPYETALQQRQIVAWRVALSALRRGLKPHLHQDIRELSLRQIVTEVDKIAATGKRGAAENLRKYSYSFLAWCVSQGRIERNPLLGYRKPKQSRAERIGRRIKGRALTDDEIIKVWNACGKLGAFGLLVRLCLLGGARRGEPARIEWQRHVMDDRITFDENWTKMGLHHDVPRTLLVDDVLTAAKHFQRATSDYVFPSPKTGERMSGFTKLVARLIREAGVEKFTLHDLRRSLRTIMSRCGYDNEIQRLCVGQKPRGIDQVYNHDEQWIIRKMAFEAAHDYIAQLIGEKRSGKVVRLQRTTNPLTGIKAELLNRLHEYNAKV